MCGKLQEVSANAVALEMRLGPLILAREASRVLPGQWWVGRGVVTGVIGRNTCYLVDWHRLDAIKSARAAVTSLGVEAHSWSLGGLCRKLLSWLGPPHPHRKSSARHLGGLPWGYLRVRPGRYPDQRHLDLESAYWQSACRLPSPRLTWLDTGPLWHPLPPDEASRWRDLLLAVHTCKPLRVALNGSMLGSSLPPWVYHRGERLALRPKEGPYKTAALAIVRACYEMTALQAEASSACYANTDCLIVGQNSVPHLWEELGYSYRVEALGDAHILSPDVYQVGERQTAWYRRGSRLALAHTDSPLPDTLTYKAWH